MNPLFRPIRSATGYASAAAMAIAAIIFFAPFVPVLLS